MSLTLVGLPLSGKSTIGRLLAQQLRHPYWDLDALLNKEHRWDSIAHGINQVGVARFRIMEYTALLRQLTQPAPWVLATGGGAPCHANAMAAVCAHSYVIYLRLSWEALHMRLQQDRQPTQRPLLHAHKDTDALHAYLATRIPIYEQAHVCMDAHPDPLHIVQEIVTQIAGSMTEKE